MDVKKCDRCGEYYVPFREYSFLAFNDPTGITFIFDDTQEQKRVSIEKYDLCPECIKEIKNFLKHKS